VYQVQS